jgi:nucleotide-binding universal stress UspA family protein
MNEHRGQPAGGRLGLTRVLVAVDDAPESMRAAQAAIAVAASTGARLRVISVIQDGVFLRALSRASSEPRGAERMQTAATAVLRHVSELAAGAEVSVETVVRDGDPGEEIVAEAARWAADLVVMGRCEGSRVSRPVIGPAAQHVLEMADSPVLVVP